MPHQNVNVFKSSNTNEWMRTPTILQHQVIIFFNLLWQYDHWGNRIKGYIEKENVKHKRSHAP